jgi:hypothetical protein
MTITCKLEYRTHTTVINSLSLIGGTDGFYLLDWVPEVGDDDLPRPIETLTVAVEGSSHNDLADKISALDDFVQFVKDSISRPINPQVVRFEVKLDNETGERSSTVYKITSRFSRALNRPPVSPGNFIDEYVITIERDHWWEQHLYGAELFQLATGIGCPRTGTVLTDYGSKTDGDVGGTVKAKITSVQIRGDQSHAYNANEVWVGLRTDAIANDRTNFQPVWNCKDATQILGDCTLQSTSTAISGSLYECDFTMQTILYPRNYLQLDDVTSYPEDQRGTYLVLLRARCTGSETYTGRVDSGFYNPTDPVLKAGPTFTIDQGSQFLYPAGYVSIPPARYAQRVDADANFLLSYCLVVNAGILSSGTGNLQMDALILVPVDEGFMYINNSWISSAYNTWVVTDAFGGITSHSWGGYTVESPIVSPIDWSLPLGKGAVVLIAQRSDEQNRDDSYGIDFLYSKRYRTLRGSD